MEIGSTFCSTKKVYNTERKNVVICAYIIDFPSWIFNRQRAELIFTMTVVDCVSISKKKSFTHTHWKKTDDEAFTNTNAVTNTNANKPGPVEKKWGRRKPGPNLKMKKKPEISRKSEIYFSLLNIIKKIHFINKKLEYQQKKSALFAGHQNHSSGHQSVHLVLCSHSCRVFKVAFLVKKKTKKTLKLWI